MGNFRGAAVEILSDELEFVTGFNLSARSHIACNNALGKFRKLVHGLQHALAKHPNCGDARKDGERAQGLPSALQNPSSGEDARKEGERSCAIQRGTRISGRGSGVSRLRDRM